MKLDFRAFFPLQDSVHASNWSWDDSKWFLKLYGICRDTGLLYVLLETSFILRSLLPEQRKLQNDPNGIFRLVIRTPHFALLINRASPWGRRWSFITKTQCPRLVLLFWKSTHFITTIRHLSLSQKYHRRNTDISYRSMIFKLHLFFFIQASI